MKRFKGLKILISSLTLCLFVTALETQASYKDIAKRTVAIEVITEGITSRYGTGVIFSRKGKVVTAGHVVTMAATITVTTNTGAKYPAMIIAIDEGIDLAALEVTDLMDTPVSFAFPVMFAQSRVRINEKLETVGNPYRLAFSYDRFRVSHVRPYILNPGEWIIYKAIQVNKSLSPGFSGAGAFNEQGELVGIASLTAQKGNITFLNPVSEITKFLESNSVIPAVD